MAKELKFEEKIKRIELIVDQLDKGDTQLDEMIKLFEEGMKLASECREYLENSEMKVNNILEKYSETKE